MPGLAAFKRGVDFIKPDTPDARAKIAVCRLFRDQFAAFPAQAPLSQIHLALGLRDRVYGLKDGQGAFLGIQQGGSRLKAGGGVSQGLLKGVERKNRNRKSKEDDR